MWQARVALETVFQLHGNTKPVDRAALVVWKQMVKLLWWKQEPDIGYGLSIFG